MNSIQLLDLQFNNKPGIIATYVLPHSSGAVLIDCGPGSTQHTLLAELQKHGFSIHDITHVLLTHIHLDHAGAAGWLAQHGALIYVHEAGAPHLADPTKLLRSTARVYGDQMERLWGQFLPVPEKQLLSLANEGIVEIDNLRIKAIPTPGHANHHFVYICENTMFTGDVGGIRRAGEEQVAIPTPPPEFHLEKWRASIQFLMGEKNISRLALSHYGFHSDPAAHLKHLSQGLDRLEAWLEKTMPAQPELPELQAMYTAWVTEQKQVTEPVTKASYSVEAANISQMSAAGLQRYWQKYRMEA